MGLAAACAQGSQLPNRTTLGGTRGASWPGPKAPASSSAPNPDLTGRAHGSTALQRHGLALVRGQGARAGPPGVPQPTPFAKLRRTPRGDHRDPYAPNNTRVPVEGMMSFAGISRWMAMKESNGKHYGTSGKKIGNAHLTWAFSEAAVLFLKRSELAQKYLAKLATRHGQGKALSILAHTLGRAVFFMRKQHVAFDQE